MSKRKRREEKNWRKRNLKDKASCNVYVVRDAEGIIRYCGQTRCSPTCKRDWIIRSAYQTKRKTPFQKWLIEQIQSSREWRVEVIDKKATWDVSEILWIKELRDKGAPLLNIARGGADRGKFHAPICADHLI